MLQQFPLINVNFFAVRLACYSTRSSRARPAGPHSVWSCSYNVHLSPVFCVPALVAGRLLSSVSSCRTSCSQPSSVRSENYQNIVLKINLSWWRRSHHSPSENDSSEWYDRDHFQSGLIDDRNADSQLKVIGIWCDLEHVTQTRTTTLMTECRILLTHLFGKQFVSPYLSAFFFLPATYSKNRSSSV